MKIKKIVDLSYPITNDIFTYPGDPKPQISPATTIEKDGFNVQHVHLGSHTGTHVDAPYHFKDGGHTIDQSPLTNFMGEGVLMDVTGKGEGEAINLVDIASYLDKLSDGKIALFYTGWSKYANTDQYFRHPYISIEVVKELIARGVKTFFIDTLNIDQTGSDSFSAHDAITSINGIIGENFTNFDKINFDNPMIIAFPLSIVGSDGSPVRAVAVDLDISKG